jgi:hypothetical protein
MARPGATSHATVTVMGPSPPGQDSSRLGEAVGVNRHSGFRQPGALDVRRASPDRCRSLPADGSLDRHRTIPHAGPLKAASPAIFSAVLAVTFQGVGRRAAADPRRSGNPAATKPNPAAIPHHQLFRTLSRIPADTGTPRIRGMRRQRPE